VNSSPVDSLLAAAPGADLPWSVHLAAGLALIVGIVIWVAGGRLMRPAFIVLGMLIGAAVAHLVPHALRQWTGEWVLAGLGAVAGALVGWLAFRVLVANTLAMVVAIVAALAVSGFVRVETPAGSDARLQGPGVEAAPSQPGSAPEQSLEEWAASLQVRHVREGVARAVAQAKERIHAEPSAPDTPPGSIADLTVERGSRALRVFGARLGEQVYAFWNEDLGPRGRAMILLALALGYLGGLVLGFALPKRAAAVTTAMIGPAVWLPAAAYITVALGLPIAQRVPADPLVWLLAWAALASLGVGIQVIGSRKKAIAAAGK
jgi:hypothetical protein